MTKYAVVKFSYNNETLAERKAKDYIYAISNGSSISYEKIFEDEYDAKSYKADMQWYERDQRKNDRYAWEGWRTSYAVVKVIEYWEGDERKYFPDLSKTALKKLYDIAKDDDKADFAKGAKKIYGVEVTPFEDSEMTLEERRAYRAGYRAALREVERTYDINSYIDYFMPFSSSDCLPDFYDFCDYKGITYDTELTKAEWDNLAEEFQAW